MTTVVWFRRDLRLGDHPALVAAAETGERVIALFVADPRLLRTSGPARVAFLSRCLRSLDDSIGGRLVVRDGDPATVVTSLAADVGARQVYISADFGPYGYRRDDVVEAALTAAGRRLVRVGSPYAVEPGLVCKGDGEPFSVFTPFYRTWKALGWTDPMPAPREIDWVDGLQSERVPTEPSVAATLPAAGEAAALARLDDFTNGPSAAYDTMRDRPGADATTRLSPYLKFGCIHPRQVLARLGSSPADEKLRSELAWREFYADVLWHRPDSAHRSLQPSMTAMSVDTGPVADERFTAWAFGLTGYPLVDAAMRQLLAEAWMPNRVRMVVASFLVKDLHIDWTRGAEWFMGHLVDGDLASNAQGWQWVAGTGTDPAPYFRIFNPTAQAKAHDPDGRYIRRWIPELAGLSPPLLFEPWKAPGGPPDGYPAPLVDHADERAEALDRYAAMRRAR